MAKLLRFDREDAHGAEAIVNPLQVSMLRSYNDKVTIIYMSSIEIRVQGSLEEVQRRIEQEIIRL